MGNEFFEHDMEVGATKTEGTHAGAPHTIGRGRPRSQLGIDAKWGMGKIDIRIGMLAMQAGRQYLIPKRQSGFQQSCGAGRPFEMPKV